MLGHGWYNTRLILALDTIRQRAGHRGAVKLVPAEPGNLFHGGLSMARYYLKAFLTLTPQELLQQYFQKEILLQTFDWDKDFTLDDLHDAILEKADVKKVEFDFRMIHQWADETGIDNLIEEARSPIHDGLEIGEELGKLENEHACAMYVWLKYPKVFYWAMELKAWEYRKSKKHHYVGTGLPCDGNDKGIRDSLGSAIAEYYKKLRKGSRCDVEYYKRLNPTRHFFFANPEDSVKGYRAYDEKNKIIRQAYRPIFQVVFEYNEEDGDLAIHANGKKAHDKMFGEFCTEVLGYKEPPNAETEVFDLKVLRDTNFRFKEDDDIPVKSITLKMLMIELNKGANQKVTLEASPYNNDNRQVEAMMGRTYIAHNVKPEDVFIRKAKIEIVFKLVNMQKIRPITFTVGAPQYSDLSDDEKSEKAKRYLRKWKMLKKHKPKRSLLMPRSDKKIEQLIRIWDNGKNPIVHAKDLAFLTNGEIEGYEKRNILLFRGYSDEIQCNKCHKGSCTVPLKRVEYPDGHKKGVCVCPDQEQGGMFEFELDELRYWEVNKAKLIELGYCMEGYLVPWDKDNILYIPLQDAVNMANDDSITVRKMSKMLEDPDFPVHRMHNGRRCRVHMPEFRKWLEYAQLGKITDDAIEKYFNGVKARTEAVLQKKKSKK